MKRIFRVALVPSSVEILRKQGWNIRVEYGAGTGAKFRDRDYELAGAEITSKENVFASGLSSVSNISGINHIKTYFLV